MRKLHWFDLTSRDFQKLDPEKTVVVLPIAATEQHGPHLSVGTDSIIAQGMCDTVMKKLPAHLDVLFLPVQNVGKSNEHLRDPGTVTLTAHTLISAWTEIGESIARAGLRKLVIVNSHGGNVEVQGIVARELRVRCQMLVAQTAWRRLGVPAGLFSEIENNYGIHGGDFETSVMLHFAPNRVDMSKAVDFVPNSISYAQEYKQLRVTGFTSMAWIAEDNHPEGVAGEAHLATAEKGRQAVEFQTDRFIELLEDVAKFPLSRLA
ncbi:MAG: creatininase family protein [Methylobacterium sp.]|jgi:creatinine amidohydrolase|nr:creatininase family protein [Methylobacterium sp.]MCA3638075.1 creatininase family protein [Methylobacterium sp.]